MDRTCKKCGLPLDLCTCGLIAKEAEKIKIHLDKKRYGKFVTVVEGIGKEAGNKNVLKELKTRLACGGTMKDDTIELQGNHRNKIKEILIKLGFTDDQIEVA